jgi:DHA1 family multidrug resistance protein-like MFS transporter
MAVYMGSSIYAPSELGIMAEFGVNIQLASMGLSMYVLAYGLGPMLWSPLSEIPAIGRNPIYIATMLIFVILIIPAALTPTFAGLIVARFLQGFFGSPCLATGGASLGDMFSIIKLPYLMSSWVSCNSFVIIIITLISLRRPLPLLVGQLLVRSSLDFP